jgi:2-keto-4-pentenoate hydratase/2-oxohepta-3-ene-1,7-dioic acid hydratase in catechol pathway
MGQASPVWLKEGDIVEVNLEGVGSCVNKVEYEKESSKL